MTNNSGKTTATKTEIVSVVIIYLLIIVLLYFLTGIVLGDQASNSGAPNILLFFAAIILPSTLLVYLIANIIKLRRDTKKEVPGAKYKRHLILFFTLIVLLSSIPQTIVSMRFVNSAIRTWFSPEIGEAINGGLNLSLDYYNDKIESLNTFGESPILNGLLSDIDKSPKRTWTTIKGLKPDIDSFQIFNDKRESIFFTGNEKAEILECPSLNGEDGMLPREDLATISLLRYLKEYDLHGQRYSIVFSSLLARDIDETAKRLTSAREVFLTYQKNQQEFSFLLFLFYTFFTIPLILISILISFILSQEVLRPIVSLDAATRKVAEGDFSYRILTRSNDELSNLTKSFNLMMGELENSRKKILQTEKITAWQDIARQLAHELRNPLTPIKLSAERLLRKYQRNPEKIGTIIEPVLSGIIQEVNGLDNLLKEFRDFSKIPAPTLAEDNITKLINEVLETYRTSYPQILFTFDAKNVISLEIDSGQIKQVFLNLLKNACEAIGDSDGKIFVQIDIVKKGNSSYCRIRVQDTGCGIDVEKQEKVFNPYYTTKTAGTGLGLPIIERIIYDHKGQIWFESEAGYGTTFFIDLPITLVE